MRSFPHSCVMAAAVLIWTAPVMAAETLIQVDRRAHVARADLVFDSPATRPEEGMPVGNGRMGTLVWTISTWSMRATTCSSQARSASTCLCMTRS